MGIELDKIIIRPVLTEKTDEIRKLDNIYCFEVAKEATKHDIILALRKLYNVNPQDCKIVNVKGKRKRRRFIEGKTKSWKKAYVKLKKGEKIDIGI